MQIELSTTGERGVRSEVFVEVGGYMGTVGQKEICTGHPCKLRRCKRAA